ncbi:MAG: cyclase family protein [Acidobacteria bacterium]|nr:cyclase family protein [Acidobacteriota bacterium]
MQEWLQRLGRARRIDLAQPWFVGMPHWPTHPPFLYSLTRLHGESMYAGGVTSAADAIALGTHTGTHIDALGHFSCMGRLYGGHEAAAHQSYAGGLARNSIAEVEPIARRGVLLDIAALHGVDVLAEDHVVTARECESAEARAGVRIEAGDVVLLRTGWARYFSEPKRYTNDLRTPGPKREAAGWLSGRGIFAAGSDTLAFEFSPSPAMEVHVHFLVERGIHIIEVLNLEELAAAGVYEFAFLASPMKILGATGSPLRPFALC